MRTLMLFGLCTMGAFSALQAEEPASTPATETSVVAQDPTVAAATTAEIPKAKGKECGCKH